MARHHTNAAGGLVNLQAELGSLFEVHAEEHGAQRVMTPFEFPGTGDRIIVRVRHHKEGYLIDENGEACFRANMAGGDTESDEIARWAEALASYGCVNLLKDETLAATTHDARQVALLTLRVAEAAQQLYAISTACTDPRSGDFATQLANLERVARKSLKVPFNSGVVLPGSGRVAATKCREDVNAVEEVDEKVTAYQERVSAFMEQARVWCTSHGLRVECLPAVIIESCAPKYLAPSLRILNEQSDALVAELLPTGSAIIGALGRIDLKGRFARHALLYQIGNVSQNSTNAALSDDTTSRETRRLAYSGHAGDGWYWREAWIRKAKLVDEELFLELLTDVSDHEFQ